jgi:exodeoxyribonuclease VIII
LSVPFWNDRDVRTIVELGKVVGINPRYQIPFDGDMHNALADARTRSNTFQLSGKN